MDRLITISEAATTLGVSISTMRRWERQGKLSPEYTQGKHRRYWLSQLRPLKSNTNEANASCNQTIAYARVSSHDQQSDLERQKKVLEIYCASHGWTYEIISDLGSGMNYHKRGLRKLLSSILDGNIKRLVLTHKDRLLRFGAELVFALCEAKRIEVLIINQSEEVKFEEELTKDVLEIITVFSARLYGSRSRKNKKLIQGLKDAVDAANA